MKPVSAGVDASGRNADVIALEAAGNVAAPADLVNPYAFEAAIAPHVAAAQEGRRIDLATIVAAYARLAEQVDVVVVEGAGGALVPLDDARTMLDIPVACRLPVLLVVGVRLGCLNHALLTAEAIRARGYACRVGGHPHRPGHAGGAGQRRHASRAACMRRCWAISQASRPRASRRRRSRASACCAERERAAERPARAGIPRQPRRPLLPC